MKYKKSRGINGYIECGVCGSPVLTNVRAYDFCLVCGNPDYAGHFQEIREELQAALKKEELVKTLDESDRLDYDKIKEAHKIALNIYMNSNSEKERLNASYVLNSYTNPSFGCNSLEELREGIISGYLFEDTKDYKDYLKEARLFKKAAEIHNEFLASYDKFLIAHSRKKMMPFEYMSNEESIDLLKDLNLKDRKNILAYYYHCNPITINDVTDIINEFKDIMDEDTAKKADLAFKLDCHMDPDKGAFDDESLKELIQASYDYYLYTKDEELLKNIKPYLHHIKKGLFSSIIDSMVLIISKHL